MGTLVVRPQHRALDIAVIGLGQAGGNLAAEFARRNYRAVVLNTAETDLSSLDGEGVFPSLPAEDRVYVGIDGYDGAGRDPAYGRECIQEHREHIRSVVLKQVQNADVVVITAGLGGGTGSAIIELIHVLEQDDLPIVALMTLPSEGESPIAKVNAVRAVKEVMETNLFGWIFVDNGRIAALNQDLAVAEYYRKINEHIIEPIDAFNLLNDREELNAIRSFDGEDFRKLLLCGGIILYEVGEIAHVTTVEIVSFVRDAVANNRRMPSDFDLSRLTYLGLVIEASENTLQDTPMSVMEETEDQLKSETQGGAVYQGLYRRDGAGPTTIRLIGATQTLPERMNELLSNAKQEGATFGEKIKEEVSSLELGELDGVDLFRTQTRPSRRPRRNARTPKTDAPLASNTGSDLPSEASVLRRKTAIPAASKTRRRVHDHKNTDAGRAPVRPKRRVLQKETKPKVSKVAKAAESEDHDATHDEGALQISDMGTEALDISAHPELRQPKPKEKKAPRAKPRAPSVPSDAITGDIPDPATYEQLAHDYQQSNDAVDRAMIAERLEKDSTSPSALVRYYAVDAMAKIGPSDFAAALSERLSDEDESVKTLAENSLSND